MNEKKITYSVRVGNTTISADIEVPYLEHDGSLAEISVSRERLKGHLLNTFSQAIEEEWGRISSIVAIAELGLR